MSKCPRNGNHPRGGDKTCTACRARKNQATSRGGKLSSVIIESEPIAEVSYVDNDESVSESGFYNFEYPLAEDADLVIMYPSSGKHEGYAVIHREGCKHSLTMKVYNDNLPMKPEDFEGFDDQFSVAPCARKKGAKRNPMVPI